MKNWKSRLTEIETTFRNETTDKPYSALAAGALRTKFNSMPEPQRKTFSESLSLNSKKLTKAFRDKARAWVAVKKLMLNDPATVQKLKADALVTADYLLKSDLKRFVDILDPNIQQADIGKHRPLQIGVSISGGDHPGPGSIACFVKCRKTGKPMMLGNQHVMLAQNGENEEGKPEIFQPAKNNGGTALDVVAVWERGRLNKDMDAAVAYLEEGVRFENKTPEGTIISGPSAVPVKVNDNVWKRGTMSIITRGKIQSITKNSKVPHGRFGGDIHFESQIEVISELDGKEFQIPGDSGSALVDGNNRIVGLMHGGGKGGGLATPIQKVFDALDVDFWD